MEEPESVPSIPAPFTLLPAEMQLLILNRLSTPELFRLRLNKEWNVWAESLIKERLGVANDPADPAFLSFNEVFNALKALSPELKDAVLFGREPFWTLADIQAMQAVRGEMEDQEYFRSIAIKEGLIAESDLVAEDVLAQQHLQSISFRLFTRWGLQALRSGDMTLGLAQEIINSPNGFTRLYRILSENGVRAMQAKTLIARQVAEGECSDQALEDVYEHGATPEEQLKSKMLMTLGFIGGAVFVGALLGGLIGGAIILQMLSVSASAFEVVMVSAAMGALFGAVPSTVSSYCSFFKPVNHELPNPANNNENNIELQEQLAP